MTSAAWPTDDPLLEQTDPDENPWPRPCGECGSRACPGCPPAGIKLSDEEERELLELAAELT